MANNTMVTFVSFVSFCMDNIDTYNKLARTYDSNNDIVNTARCKEYVHAIDIVITEINDYANKYDDDVNVVGYINSDSTIWHIQSYIGKQIDRIMAWGYHYVMRDSATLKWQYKCFEMLYDELVKICKENNVYC